MGEFRMPSLGADMEYGTVDQWLVKPGDRVKRGDIVAVVGTEKADIEVEIFEDGVIEEIVVPEGQRVAVGTVLATVQAEEEAAPAGAAPVAEPRPEPVAVVSPVSPVPQAPRVASPVVRRRARELGVDLSVVEGRGPGGAITREDVERAARPPGAPRLTGERALASPLARRAAEELGVDLGEVTGTGPDGAITEADVRRAASPVPTVAPPAPAREPEPAVPEEAPAAVPEEAPAREPVHRQEALRQAIARLMARSKREIPHYYLETRIDLSRALAWLEAENERGPVAERLLPSVLLLKAAALAAREVPEMNGFWVDGAFQPSEAVHLGVAISLRGGGLIAPALHDADRKTLGQMMGELRDLVNRARAGRLRGSEMSDPTITITNLGERGVETVHGVIYVPQVALVGFGRIVERPWAEDGMIGTRPVVSATLAADHRASDGHRGGLFLVAIDRLLQTPEEL